MEDALENIISALEFHLEGIINDGEEAPRPKGLEFYKREKEFPSGRNFLFTEVELKIPITI